MCANSVHSIAPVAVHTAAAEPKQARAPAPAQRATQTTAAVAAVAAPTTTAADTTRRSAHSGHAADAIPATDDGSGEITN